MISLVRKLNFRKSIGRPPFLLLFPALLLIVFDGLRAFPPAAGPLSLKLVEPAASAATSTTASTAVTAPSPSGAARPLIAAHRGASAGAPENTMAAFRLAARLGADYIELDVQRSADGRLVVLHDVTVNRTTDGTGDVGKLSFDELRRLDAGSRFGPAYAGERIPSLDEVLDAELGKTGLLIELKNPGRYPGIVRQLAALLAARLRIHPSLKGKLIVQSFDHDAVRRFHTYLPSVPTAVLVSGRRELRAPSLHRYAGYATYVNVPYIALSPRLMRRIHKLGLRAFVWTVHNREQAGRAARFGADGVITDNPAALLPNGKQPDVGGGVSLSSAGLVSGRAHKSGL